MNKAAQFRSILFFFCAAYFFLYIFPFPVGYNGYFASATKDYYQGFDFFIIWFGRHFFHLPSLTFVSTGSGDRAYNYVQMFTMAVFAAAITMAWHAIGRKRNNADILFWLVAYIQLYLAVTLIRYGLIKVIKAQFPFPYYSLTETYGDSSPLRLLISFMGYSTVYNVITGAVEVAAGLLILFRRTVLLGSLIALGALLNVVMINFCYDVPVKLHALNLLWMAMFVAAPFAGRLTDFFILNKAIPVENMPVSFRNNRLNRLLLTGKMALAVILLCSNLQYAHSIYRSYGDGAFQHTPLFGIYKVQTFIKNKDTLLPLLTDTSQWRTLTVLYKKNATIRLMNDSAKNCQLLTDTLKRKITIRSKDDIAYRAEFLYQQPDAAHLLLTGKLKEDSVSILLEKQDLSKYRLVNRGFHWVNEYPYNK